MDFEHFIVAPREIPHLCCLDLFACLVRWLELFLWLVGLVDFSWLFFWLGGLNRFHVSYFWLDFLFAISACQVTS